MTSITYLLYLGLEGVDDIVDTVEKRFGKYGSPSQIVKSLTRLVTVTKPPAETCTVNLPLWSRMNPYRFNCLRNEDMLDCWNHLQVPIQKNHG